MVFFEFLHGNMLWLPIRIASLKQSEYQYVLCVKDNEGHFKKRELCWEPSCSISNSKLSNDSISTKKMKENYFISLFKLKLNRYA